MSTVNISLTEEQLSLVNKLTKQYGFANRSEFFRAMIRRISTEPVAQKEVAEWPFVSPVTKSRAEILDAFKNKNYSSKFLSDLQEGMNNSDYFTK